MPGTPQAPKVYVTQRKNAASSKVTLAADFRWSEPESINGILSHQHVFYWMSSEPHQVSSTTLSSSARHFILDGLRGNTTYFFQVCVMLLNFLVHWDCWAHTLCQNIVLLKAAKVHEILQKQTWVCNILYLICSGIPKDPVLNYCPFDISRKDILCLAFYLKWNCSVLIDHILSETICLFCFCVLFSNMYSRINFIAKNWSDLCNFYSKVIFLNFV